MRIHLQNVHSHLVQNYVIEDLNIKDSGNISKKQDKVDRIFGERLKCQKCSYVNLRKDRLEFHMANVHNNGENFKCEKCKFETVWKNNLKQHQARVHKMQVGMKTLKCDKCTYKTFLRGNMNKHIRSVHEKIKDHACEDCDYATYSKSSLKIHRASIHNIGELSFKCNLCPFSAPERRRLRQHVNKAHLK